MRLRTPPPLRPASLLVAALLALVACGSDDPAAPVPHDAELVVLFVGNSLTYTHDLPGLVATVSAAGGRDVAVVTEAYPNFALEDHWNRGVADVIREVEPDVVVMQQGPSSFPENQEHLATWSAVVAGAALEVGAEPALLMVWPGLTRFFAFDDVRDAYRNAALAVEGEFIPAGEALRALHERHPERAPFGPDGFHPSSVGSLLAAMVTAGTLFDLDVTALPDTLPSSRHGSPRVTFDPELGDLLRSVADSVVKAWR